MNNKNVKKKPDKFMDIFKNIVMEINKPTPVHNESGRGVVKSDDVDGRAKIYESMVKGENTLEPGTPVSFNVLTHEIKGLGFCLELHKRRDGVPSPAAMPNEN